MTDYAILTRMVRRAANVKRPIGQSDVDLIATALETTTAEVARLTAENARLREALEHADQHIGQYPVGEDAPDYVRYAHVMLAEIRQALGEPND